MNDKKLLTHSVIGDFDSLAELMEDYKDCLMKDAPLNATFTFRQAKSKLAQAIETMRKIQEIEDL